MKSNSLQRLITGFTILLVMIGLPLVSIVGHGHKHDDDKHDSDSTSDSIVSTISDSAKDSIYALINEKYITVRHLFKYSCFDCHSDSSENPWYHFIPGISGMIDDDMKEAKEHLNLTNDFPFGGHATQVDQLEEIRKEIENGTMPLKSYRFMHWGRLIEGDQKDSVFAWIDESIALLKSK